MNNESSVVERLNFMIVLTNGDRSDAIRMKTAKKHVVISLLVCVVVSLVVSDFSLLFCLLIKFVLKKVCIELFSVIYLSRTFLTHCLRFVTSTSTIP